MSIPKNPIQELREEFGYTVKELADLHGVSVQVINSYESQNFNHNNCKLQTIRDLADIFNISLEYFVAILDEYKAEIDKNHVQGFSNPPTDERIYYECYCVINNYTPKVLGLKVINKETRERSFMTRQEVISLTLAHKISIDGISVGRNGSIRCSHRIPAKQTYRQDDYIPEEMLKVNP